MHELVELVLQVLDATSLVSLWVPWHPHTDRANKHIVVGIDLTEHLAAELSLCLGRIATTDLNSACVGLELVLLPELLAQAVFIRVDEGLVFVLQSSSEELILLSLAELLHILGEPVELKVILERQKAKELRELLH